MLRIISIILIGISLSACSFLEGKSSDHTVLCNQLKNRIIMSGATPNQRVATQQLNDLNRLTKSYRDEGCVE